MAHWAWIERKFNFDFPVGKFPDILERIRGTPARVEDQVVGLAPEMLVRSDGAGWSIQENVGHIMGLNPLTLTRIDEILAGAPVLTAADMTNRRTQEADYNARDMKELLAELRSSRRLLVDRLERLFEVDWAKSSLHPRLNQPMRMVDLAFFHAEHDDYHLARIRELIVKLA
jgi:hypothetical protein